MLTLLGSPLLISPSTSGFGSDQKIFCPWCMHVVVIVLLCLLFTYWGKVDQYIYILSGSRLNSKTERNYYTSCIILNQCIQPQEWLTQSRVKCFKAKQQHVQTHVGHTIMFYTHWDVFTYPYMYMYYYSDSCAAWVTVMCGCIQQTTQPWEV